LGIDFPRCPEKYDDRYNLRHRILRTDLQLETCGQRACKVGGLRQPTIIRSHRNGCYIRFRKAKVGEKIHSEERCDVIVDKDKKGNVIGIEFYEGL
jgi:hypothetical protein